MIDTSTLEQIAASMTDGIVITDRTGKIRTANAALSRIFGYSKQELLGQNLQLLLPNKIASDDQHLTDTMTELTVSDEGSDGKNDIGRHKSGYPVPVWRKNFTLRLDEQETRFLTLLLDQSQGIALKEERSKAHLLYRNIDLLEGVGLWRLDIDSGDMEWTEQIFETHGLNKETFDLTLESALNCFHKEDQNRVEKTIRTAIAKSTSFEFKARIVRPDQSIRYVKSVGNSIADDLNRPFCIFGTLIDITDEQLREMELARFGSQQIILKDILYQYSQCEEPSLFCERTLKSLLGFPWSTIGKSGALFFPNQWQDGFHCAAASGLTTEVIEKLCLTCADHQTASQLTDFKLVPITRKNLTLGYLAFAKTSPAPLEQQEEEFLSAVTDVLAICIVDIHKQTTITEQNSELKTKIVKVQDLSAQHERQAQSLSRLSAELEREKARAEAASNTKSAFLANMSHEVRTPLNGVLGMLSMLELSPLEEQERECVDMAKHAAYSALHLINDILDLSHLEAGKLSINPQEFSLKELLASIKVLLGPKADEKTLDLFIENELGDCVITGDELRIQQIMVNLTENAIKFTEEGHVRLCIANDTQAEHIKITVEDTGQGMADSTLARIFDRFEQVDPSSTRRHGGVGLGLSICQNLVTLMGGTIVVQSKLGKGTRFTVSLPLRVSAPAQSHDTDAATGDLTSCQNLKILAAEDNELNQEILRRLAKALKLNLTLVENGELAFKAATQGDFDIVLMDIQMPVMDGPTATKAIRDAGSKIPIVAVTAHAMAGDRETFLASGMNGYITKPYEITELISEISRLAIPEASPTMTPPMDQAAAS